MPQIGQFVIYNVTDVVLAGVDHVDLFLLHIETDALEACLRLFNDQRQTDITQTYNTDYEAAVFDFLEHGLFHNVFPL